MIASVCHHENRVKFGKDRKGHQRWKCRGCGIIITEYGPRPLGDMRISMEQAEAVLMQLLRAGSSIRATEAITGVNRDTICDLVLLLGEKCDRFLQGNVRGVASNYVELDEVWAFVGCKAKHAAARNLGSEVGDAWTWFAIDGESKLILSHTTGKRDDATCARFLTRLNGAVVGRTQVTSDGYGSYTYNVPLYLGSRVDFAQLVKHYKSSTSEGRYSPGTITGIDIVPRFGNPDEAHVSTAYAERLNLSVRMHNRRLTRLTNAHSKSFDHHVAMQSLFAAWYNFCRDHLALKQGKVKRTPAMAAGLTDRVWSIRDLLTAAA